MGDKQEGGILCDLAVTLDTRTPTSYEFSDLMSKWNKQADSNTHWMAPRRTMKVDKSLPLASSHLRCDVVFPLREEEISSSEVFM